MVRVIAALVGIFFSGMLLYSFVFGAVNYIGDPPAPTVEHEFHLSPKEVEFASDGPLGHYDRPQLQRGFQVFKEVCSACHSLRIRSEEHTSELQSLMRISYAVFCLKNKKRKTKP